MFRNQSINTDSDARRSALAFLDEYSEKDIVMAVFSPDSLLDWPVSRAGRQKLIDQLSNDLLPINLLVRLTMVRKRVEQQAEGREHTWSSAIELDTDADAKLTRRRLIAMINGTAVNSDYAAVDLHLPPYLLAPPEGNIVEATPMNAAVESAFRQLSTRFKLISIVGQPDHWRVEMNTSSSATSVKTSAFLLDASPSVGIDGDASRRNLQLIVFVDRVVPSWMAFVIGSGGYDNNLYSC
jgi:hypothetical protein